MGHIFCCVCHSVGGSDQFIFPPYKLAALANGSYHDTGNTQIIAFKNNIDTLQLRIKSNFKFKSTPEIRKFI